MNHLKKIFRLMLPVLVIVLAVAGAVILFKTRPRPQPRSVQEVATLAEVQRLQKTRHAVRLETTGTVIPAQEIELQARVSGEVLSMNDSFLPGGRFAAGERILKLDPEDYELVLQMCKSDLAQAELSDAQEQGMQTVARHEWELLDSREDLPAAQQDLILRRPQLAASAAALESARASVHEAELNLARTDVRAPFDAVVLERSVNVGAQVSSQTILGTLAGTKEYWVEVTLPVRDLHWLQLPGLSGEKGSAAEIRRSDEAAALPWAGYVLKLDSQLEEKGRLARVLVAVPDPLAEREGGLPLLLGMHVRVMLDGPELDDVFVLPRGALHDGRFVWLMNGKNRLEIREISPLWSDADVVVVRDGLQEGEQLVISDLAIPVTDMLLTTRLSDPSKSDSGASVPSDADETVPGE